MKRKAKSTRLEDALPVLQSLLAGDPKKESFLVNQIIDWSDELWRHGRFREAIETAQKAHGFSSPYGEMWIQSISVCAHFRLGQTQDAEAALSTTLKTTEVNYGAALQSLLCLGREDETAALLVKMLQSDEQRGYALRKLQNCRENPNQPGLMRDLRAALIKIRERPDVSRAIAAAGVVISVPVACGDD